MSVLEDLYYGNIHPCDKYIKKGSEYEKLLKSMTELEEQFLKRLTAKDKKVYEHIFNLRFSQEAISEKEVFIEGFRLGAQIVLEIISKADQQLLGF